MTTNGCHDHAVAGQKVLVTGSSGHLGEALIRVLRDRGREVVGVDVHDSSFTTVVGSITDRGMVRECLRGVGVVLHAATLHKPHVGSHDRQAFVDTNIAGTLVLLEEAVTASVESFVFTSTTSTFGHALTPAPGAPAAWITEDVNPIPKNIYGVTKIAAENVCELIHREHGLPQPAFHPVTTQADLQEAVRTAVRMALLSKFQDHQALVLDGLALNQPRTKEVARVLRAIRRPDLSESEATEAVAGGTSVRKANGSALSRQRPSRPRMRNL